MTVVTDISVCINITKQNGMSFSGIRLCKEYSTGVLYFQIKYTLVSRTPGDLKISFIRNSY